MIPGTNKLFPLQCDAFICKVVVDETSRDDFWHYEDIDPGSEKQLREFGLQVTEILEDIRFGSDEGSVVEGSRMLLKERRTWSLRFGSRESRRTK